MRQSTIDFRGNLVLSDRILPRGTVQVVDDRIAAVGESVVEDGDVAVIDAGDGYIVPGFVDIHVHGGAGADFMDGTDEAFATALAAHARHGTTSMAVTTTVARHDQIMTVLETTRRFRQKENSSGRACWGSSFLRPVFPLRSARGPSPAGRSDRQSSTSIHSTHSNSPIRSSRAPWLLNCRGPRNSSGGLHRPRRCAPMPAIRGPRSRRWPSRSNGACGTSITCFAPCPTKASCGSFR